MSTDNDTAMHLAGDLDSLRRLSLLLLGSTDTYALDLGERGALFGTLASAIERVTLALADAMNEGRYCPQCGEHGTVNYIGMHHGSGAVVRGCTNCGNLYMIGGDQ